MWQDIALVALLHHVGTILLGHFEAATPKWRRIAKIAVVAGATGAVSNAFGHTAVWIVFFAMLAVVGYIHAIVLPRRGIHGWTGEPISRR